MNIYEDSLRRDAEAAYKKFIRSSKGLFGVYKKKKGLKAKQPQSLESPAVRMAAEQRPARRRRNQASLALACSTIPAKAALSCTAISASTLRSRAMPALFMPLMNWL